MSSLPVLAKGVESVQISEGLQQLLWKLQDEQDAARKELEYFGTPALGIRLQFPESQFANHSVDYNGKSNHLQYSTDKRYGRKVRSEARKHNCLKKSRIS
jgi:hypothetical protein